MQRQAFAGLLWNKQFYHYKVGKWLNGDPNFPVERNFEHHVRNVRMETHELQGHYFYAR